MCTAGSLDRVQMVKGWVNADGSLGEKVYDIAWSGDRKMDENGKIPSVGNSVNIEDATWSNDIGAAELSKVWTDPSFDSSQESFYYVRVIEIPTPRWTLYDKVKYGAELGPEIPITTTEIQTMKHLNTQDTIFINFKRHKSNAKELTATHYY